MIFIAESLLKQHLLSIIGSGINPYIDYLQDTKDYILVIDRNDCYFASKVEHAQLMKASGVILCDSKIGNLFTPWLPSNWEDNIDIPSVLLSNTNCQTLMQHIGVINWDPNESSNLRMEYPSTNAMNWTMATIEWGLPHPDDMVEYELN